MTKRGFFSLKMNQQFKKWINIQVKKKRDVKKQFIRMKPPFATKYHLKVDKNNSFRTFPTYVHKHITMYVPAAQF